MAKVSEAKPLPKGVREGKPENVIWILKWVGESSPTYVPPGTMARYRYANGTVPEGTLVDASEVFRGPREQPSTLLGPEQRQEVLF